MSVEAAYEQGQSWSVLKRPFISYSLWDIPFPISVYSPSNDAVLMLCIFVFPFFTNFFTSFREKLHYDTMILFCLLLLSYKIAVPLLINSFFTRSWLDHEMFCYGAYYMLGKYKYIGVHHQMSRCLACSLGRYGFQILIEALMHLIEINFIFDQKKMLIKLIKVNKNNFRKIN